MNGVARRLLRPYSIVYWRARYLVDDWWPDRRLGVETRGIERNTFDDAGGSVRTDLQFYEPVSPRSFRTLLRALPSGVISTHTFVDAGAGKGRALFLAAESGFRCGVGIELDPRLADAARANVARYRERRGAAVCIEIMECDATEYALPPRPLVLFLYNPFVGEAMDLFLARFIESQAEVEVPSWILYRNPKCHDAIMALPGLREAWRSRGHAVYVTTPGRITRSR